MSEPFDLERTQYLIAALSPARLTRIVDVGANPIGVTPYKGLMENELCEVWGFEPQVDAHAKLVKQAGPREHYLPYAIGPKGTATLNLCRGSGLTSLLDPNTETFDALGRFHRTAAVLDQVEIELHPLDDMDDLPVFDLLKIDIQGAETAVFKSGQNKLKNALAVITEVAAIPLYHDQPLLDQQMSALGALGFHYHKMMFMKSAQFENHAYASRLPFWKYASQAIDGDAIFIRGLLDVKGMALENLKHLAILADGVFFSQDLTVNILAELEQRGELGEDDIHDYIDLLPRVRERV